MVVNSGDYNSFAVTWDAARPRCCGRHRTFCWSVGGPGPRRCLRRNCCPDDWDLPTTRERHEKRVRIDVRSAEVVWGGGGGGVIQVSQHWREKFNEHTQKSLIRLVLLMVSFSSKKDLSEFSRSVAKPVQTAHTSNQYTPPHHKNSPPL